MTEKLPAKTKKAKAENLILLVDDTVDHRQITRMRLEQLSYNIVEASDAETMHKELDKRGKQFKAVFLDQKLGNDPRGGLELLPEIKRRFPELAVIMYTATLEDLGEEAMSRGAFWYLNKLFVSPYELANVLDNVIRMQKMRDEHALLFEENELLKALLNAIDQEIMVRKPDGKILWVNRAKLDKFPDLEKEMEKALSNQTTIICYKFWEGESQRKPCTACISQKAIETKTIQKGDRFYDDAACNQEIMGFPILNEKNEVTAVVELVRDVTRTRHLHDLAERLVALEAENEKVFWDKVAGLIEEKLYFRRVRIYRVLGSKKEKQSLECIATRGYLSSADPKGKTLPFFETLKHRAGGSTALEPALTSLDKHAKAYRKKIQALIDPDQQWLLVPVRHEGELQWQISLDNKGLRLERPLADADIQAARFVARVISDAVANRQLREDLQWIRELQQVLDTAGDMRQTANQLLKTAREKGLCDFGKVLVASYDQKCLRTLKTDDHVAECHFCVHGQKIDEGLNGLVFKTGKSAFIEDTDRFPLISRYRKENKHLFKCPKCSKTPVMAAVPLKKGRDVIGILDVFFEGPHVFSDRERRLLGELAAGLSSSLGIARRIERAQNLILQTHALSSRAFFLGGMSHKIRGHLNTIVPGFDVLAQGNLSPDKVSEKARQLKKVSLLLLDIFEKAMQVRYATPSKPSVLSVSKVVGDVVSATNFDDRDVTVSVKTFVKSEPQVMAQRESLEMALESLLQNAYDAVPDKGAVINITVDTEDTYAVVKIEDNGKGVPEDVVMDPYSPMEKAKEGKGGMGWYFAHWALDRMGGHFEIGKTAEGRTLITVRIPLYKENIQ